VGASRSHLTALWRSALRDAPGTLAAYVTPPNYGIANWAVRGVGAGDRPDPLEGEIRRRIDLGRATAFEALTDQLTAAATTAFRHEIVYEPLDIRGKLHVPRYITALAQGGARGIPVIYARRKLLTPENLLVSEALRESLRVANLWSSLGGAEGRHASRLAVRLERIDARYPWAELRSVPRPSLVNLISIVQGRLIAGMVQEEEPILHLTKLLTPPMGDLSALEAADSALQALLVKDERFADRIFELLVLGWLIKGLSRVTKRSKLWPERIKGAMGRPLFEGYRGNARYRIYFQTGSILGQRLWTYRHTQDTLGGIPDIVITREREGEKTSILVLDPKNRSWKHSRGEVAYKMIGYSCNLNLEPFRAIAVFPSTRAHFRIAKSSLRRRGLQSVRLLRGADEVILLRVSLDFGQRVMDHLAHSMVASTPSA
jgi:hypothetical protein